MGRKEFNHL